MKVGLGTAQWGMDYGVSNTKGQTSRTEVGRIVGFARQRGVRMLDTAAAYGNSEDVLGEILQDDDSFRIVTKTPVLNQDRITQDDADRLVDACSRSLRRLKRKKIYGLLIHNVRDVLAPGGDLLLERLSTLVEEGRVEKVGVSIYTAWEIDRVLAVFKPDIVQVPINVFDQRLLQSGHLRRMKEMGIEIHARSIFLQGLLLMEPSDVPSNLEFTRERLARFHTWLAGNNMSRIDAALRFVVSLREIDVALVGVTSEAELSAILEKYSESPMPFDLTEWAVSDERMLNPSLWKGTA